MSLILGLAGPRLDKNAKLICRDSFARVLPPVLCVLVLTLAVLPCAAQESVSSNQSGATNIRQGPDLYETDESDSNRIGQPTRPTPTLPSQLPAPTDTEPWCFRGFTADFGGGWKTWVDGSGLKTGINFRGGAGWRLGPPSGRFNDTGDRLRERHWSLYLVGEFVFIQSALTETGVQTAIQLNPALSSATSATARYYSTTADPTFRYCFLNCRATFYSLGGFGWMHRTVEFDSPPSATSPIGSNTTVARFGYDSPAYDVGGGVTLGPFKPTEGLTYYVEGRRLAGLGSNQNSTLWPLSIGIRW